MIKQLGKDDLIVEMYGGEPYEYYPLGKYIVRAPGVCGGRPTFKYTRLETRVILRYVAEGESIDSILQNYRHSKISREAILEAIFVANEALEYTSERLLPLAA